MGEKVGTGRHLLAVMDDKISEGLNYSSPDIWNSSAIFDSEKINAAVNTEAILLITDKNGVILYLNQNCCENVGYRPDELIGKHTRIFKTGIHNDRFYHELWATLLAGKVWKGEMTARRKDGTIVWNFLSAFPIFDENNEPYQFLTLRTDITEQKKLETQTAQKDKQLQAIIENTTDVIGSFDSSGTITFLNSHFETNSGYSVAESIGKSIFEFIADDCLQKTKNTFYALIRSPGRSVHTEIKMKSNKGVPIWYDVVATNYLQDLLLKGVHFTCRDITRQKRISEELRRAAFYDFLTGFPNRRSFVYHLKKVLVNAERTNSTLTLMLIDIDEFKYVNDSFGHVVGDQLLIDVAVRIKNVYTEGDFFARLGGDEFVCMISNRDNIAEIKKLANKLVSLINLKPFTINENEFYITASVGVSVFPYSGNNMESLLKNADLAMYRAKHSGKNQYQIFSPTMNLFSYKQFTLRNDSKKALQNDEFHVYYQPKYDPDTNVIKGGEALIRWNHPRWGIVPPNEFISMAEESGLIIQIGSWMLRNISLQIKKWDSEGIKLKKVSINLSALELMQANFIEMVTSVIEEIQIDPKWIEFEITERMIIDKEEKALKTLMQLKNLGFSIALDDFGTGYSAINYLWKFPCDTIKIDKSLIKEISKNNASYEIVSAVVNLCKKLNKSVVAEGVETKEQLELLRKLSCDEIQGYYYSRPVEEQKFVQLLKDEKWFQQSTEKNASFVNKRTYFRVPFEYPLEADMTIERIGIKKLDIGSSKVLIENIGPGGLRFLSTIRLPQKEDIILQFTTEIFSGILKVNGHIVWTRELEDDVCQYGVKFTIDEVQREGLIKILHHLQLVLKDKNMMSSGRFISEEKLSYVKNQAAKNYTS